MIVLQMFLLFQDEDFGLIIILQNLKDRNLKENIKVKAELLLLVPELFMNITAEKKSFQILMILWKL